MPCRYNGVLRGKRSEVAFLKTKMIQLCCPKDVADKYVAGAISMSEAERALNQCASPRSRMWQPHSPSLCPAMCADTTTLHGINSAIVKLGKLTVATKVYRGISGMQLPKEFWTANEFGVKGGIEGAFMSTTKDRRVAMQYAASGSAGLVFEIQQGMSESIRLEHCAEPPPPRCRRSSNKGSLRRAIAALTPCRQCH